ncbi:MAG TPA: ABA4-like family protein [Saprospiraceae bacterium]|nr:ABA4-like family protein [Saprospiraceae bacterium]
MEVSTLFQFCNGLALAGWIALLLSPYFRKAMFIIQKGIVPLLLGVVYSYLLLKYFATVDGNFTSLEGVKNLFQSDGMVLAGWVHYLAFDLWVGSWELGDSMKNKIPFWIVVPCLLLTFLFGPLGLLTYLLIRANMNRKLNHENF